MLLGLHIIETESYCTWYFYLFIVAAVVSLPQLCSVWKHKFLYAKCCLLCGVMNCWLLCIFVSW